MIAYWDTKEEAEEIIEEMGLTAGVAIKAMDGLWYIKRNDKMSGVPLYLQDLP